jgi:hypothetical protein
MGTGSGRAEVDGDDVFSEAGETCVCLFRFTLSWVPWVGYFITKGKAFGTVHDDMKHINEAPRVPIGMNSPL